MSQARLGEPHRPGLGRYRPYPEYKDSGVEWLGEIPAHWGVRRADEFTRYEKRVVDPASISDDAVYVYSIPSVQEFGGGHLQSPSELDSSKLEVLDECVLVSKLNPRKGTVVLAEPAEARTLCSTEFLPLLPAGCHARWLLYLYLEDTARQRMSAGVRSATRSHQRAELADIVKVWHAVPPRLEQRAIAAFLDREIARIDELVAKKERLIELLQEKRTALITRAVTKGLDPNVPMKDSGVEWLGEVPAHWVVRKLRWMATLRSGEALPSEEIAPEQGDGALVPVIGGNGVMGFSRLSNARQPGLALGRVGALCGNVHLVEPPAWITDNALVVSEITVVDRGFLFRVLDAMDLNRWASQNAQPLITGGFVRSQPVPVPPETEQVAIATLLDQETARIGSLVLRISEAIDQLTELRAALISAAVTGKIDVRGEAG
jgi:type I restriction enzyme S subunit